MLTHRGRRCLLVHEFSLKSQDGEVVPYILAQFVENKNFFLVYPKTEYVFVEKSIDKS